MRCTVMVMVIMLYTNLILCFHRLESHCNTEDGEEVVSDQSDVASLLKLQQLIQLCFLSRQ